MIEEGAVDVLGDHGVFGRGIVGNDVIDLRESGVLEQHRNARFVTRVFTERERSAIATAARPAHLLWAIWAAKEAAFKIARKRDERAVFAHRHYQLSAAALDGLEGAMGLGLASSPSSKADEGLELTCPRAVGAPGFAASAWWELTEDRIYCVARADAELPRSTLVSGTERRDCENESRATRAYAVRLLAQALKLDEKESARLEIVRPAPKFEGTRAGAPELWLDGKPLAHVDLSLSHDGAWSAVAATIRDRSPRASA